MYQKITFQNASEETKLETKQFLEEWYNDSDHVLVNTSGSTGTPKTIKLLKSHMVVSAKKTLNYLDIHSSEKALLCLSPKTIAGKMMIVRAIVGDLHLIIGSVSSNPLIQTDSTFDFIAMVPLQIHSVLEKNPEKLNGIKAILIGGGPISQELESKLKANGTTAFHTYGMTETISHVALRKVGLVHQDEFTALQGITFSTQQDQLVIHYPELVLDSLVTNDLVKLMNPTSFIWLGRKDFVINTGGVKIHVEEIESILSTLIKLPFFIHGKPDEKLGEMVTLIIESSEKVSYHQSQFLQYLPKYAIPKEIAIIPRFIRTESAKINRPLTIQSIDNNVFEAIL